LHEWKWGANPWTLVVARMSVKPVKMRLEGGTRELFWFCCSLQTSLVTYGLRWHWWEEEQALYLFNSFGGIHFLRRHGHSQSWSFSFAQWANVAVCLSAFAGK